MIQHTDAGVREQQFHVHEHVIFVNGSGRLMRGTVLAVKNNGVAVVDENQSRRFVTKSYVYPDTLTLAPVDEPWLNRGHAFWLGWAAGVLAVGLYLAVG